MPNMIRIRNLEDSPVTLNIRTSDELEGFHIPAYGTIALTPAQYQQAEDLRGMVDVGAVRIVDDPEAAIAQAEADAKARAQARASSGSNSTNSESGSKSKGKGSTKRKTSNDDNDETKSSS